MKKTTSKTTMSPAPAKKSTAPIAKTKVAPAVKPVAAPKVTTTIIAQIDIGFGNALYLRGEGPGLSWDRGILMNCVADNQWHAFLGESARPVVFKFLVNDLTWSIGEDYTVESGRTVTITPAF